MKTYQAFARIKENSQFILTEIKAKNLNQARDWFRKNTVEFENVRLK